MPSTLPRRSPTAIIERLDRDRQAAPQVYERLRNQIVSMALPPGSQLSRITLAQQFGVSSTPVRDALMRLEEEGLVDVFPQHATTVSQIDVSRAQQAHFLRLSIELEITRALALHHDDSLIESLLDTVALQRKYAKAGDFQKFSVADDDFHRQFYSATNNDGIWKLVRSRSGHIDRLRRLHLPTPGKAQDIVSMHRLIVKAIEAGKVDEAQTSVRKHLSGTLSYLEHIRKAHPQYLAG